MPARKSYHQYLFDKLYSWYSFYNVEVQSDEEYYYKPLIS
jgi:hypothetical protein